MTTTEVFKPTDTVLVLEPPSVLVARPPAVLVLEPPAALAPPVLEPSAPAGFDLVTDDELADDGDTQQLDRESHTSRIVSVFSPKGGTGTTFVAVNLAVALAEGGRRRVCLVDLDLEFGDVAIVTGLAPNRGIADAVGATLENDDVLDGLVTSLASGLDCVLAPIDPATAEAVSAELVAQLLARLRERYDFVVVDTPSQLSEHVLEALDAADHHVLVTTPGIPAIKNMRMLLDTLDLLGMDPAKRLIVLNQAAAKAGLQPSEVEHALRQPVTATVPASAEVALSIDAGAPLLARRRDNDVAAVIRAFAIGTFVHESPAVRRGLRIGWKSRKRSS